jgi:mannose/fructose/N-acetylgalactosamine-specific phosphotransferase system component IIC
MQTEETAADSSGVMAWKVELFPFYIGLLICLASIVIAVRSLRRVSRDEGVFVTHAQLKLVLTVLLPSMGFALVVQFLGLYVGSVLFITGFMVWIGHYGWLRSATIGFAVMALAFLMFEVWFKVPLFKGSLDPLRFLGY